MAEVLYGLIKADNAEDCINRVIDKNKKGLFYNIEISDTIMVEDDELLIVTPVYRSKELINQLKEHTGKNCIISFREWLITTE